jgi:hypothetical protein
MKSRQILMAIVILGTVWHTAAAQPKKQVEVDAPPPGAFWPVQACSPILFYPI